MLKDDLSKTFQPTYPQALLPGVFVNATKFKTLVLVQRNLEIAA